MIIPAECNELDLCIHYEKMLTLSQTPYYQSLDEIDDDYSDIDTYNCLFFKQGNVICAYLRFSINGTDLNVDSLYVEPIYQQKGIGSLLLEYIESFAEVNDCKAITLGNAYANDIANKLYENNGYEIYHVSRIKLL